MRSKNARYCPGLIDKKRKLNNDLFQVSSSNYVEFAIHNVVLCTRGYPRNVCQQRYSLRSKRFQSSYSAKFGAGAKKKWKGEGEGRRGNSFSKSWGLRASGSFTPLPLPLHSFFCSRSSFLDELARNRLLRRLTKINLSFQNKRTQMAPTS